MAAAQQSTRDGHRQRWPGARGIVVAGCCMLAAIGADAQTADPAEPTSRPSVEILRGSAAAPPPAPVEPAAGPDQRRAVGGERVWFVDEAGGTLIGCRIVNTIDVGRQAIRCTERPLPEGRPARD